MSISNEIGICQRIAMGLQTFSKSATTRVDMISSGLLPPCIPNQLANFCLCYAREIWGERVAVVISSNEKAPEIAVYDIEAQSNIFLKTAAKVIALIFVGPLGMFLRAISIYNSDVRDALRAMPLTSIPEAAPTLIVQEEKQVVEEDYFDFSAIENASLKPVLTPQEILIDYLRMDTATFQKIVETNEFKSVMQTVWPFASQSSRIEFFIVSHLHLFLPQPLQHVFLETSDLADFSENLTLFGLYASVKERAKKLGLENYLPAETTLPEKTSQQLSSQTPPIISQNNSKHINALIKLLTFPEDCPQDFIQSTDFNKQRLLELAVISSEASRLKLLFASFFNWFPIPQELQMLCNPKMESTNLTISSLYSTVSARFKRLDLQQYLPTTEEIEKKQKTQPSMVAILEQVVGGQKV